MWETLRIKRKKVDLVRRENVFMLMVTTQPKLDGILLMSRTPCETRVLKASITLPPTQTDGRLREMRPMERSA